MGVSEVNTGDDDPQTKRIKIENDKDTEKWEDLVVTNEVEYDDGGWLPGYHYDTNIEFYKNGEIIKKCKFYKYLVTNVTMYDRVDVFLPGYLPYIRRIRKNDFMLEQVRKVYKQTIDLKGIKRLVFRSNLAVEKKITLDLSNESSGVSDGEWVTDESSSGEDELKNVKNKEIN